MLWSSWKHPLWSSGTFFLSFSLIVSFFPSFLSLFFDSVSESARQKRLFLGVFVSSFLYDSVWFGAHLFDSLYQFISSASSFGFGTWLFSQLSQLIVPPNHHFNIFMQMIQFYIQKSLHVRGKAQNQYWASVTSDPSGRSSDSTTSRNSADQNTWDRLIGLKLVFGSSSGVSLTFTQCPNSFKIRVGTSDNFRSWRVCNSSRGPCLDLVYQSSRQRRRRSSEHLNKVWFIRNKH